MRRRYSFSFLEYRHRVDVFLSWFEGFSISLLFFFYLFLTWIWHVERFSRTRFAFDEKLWSVRKVRRYVYETKDTYRLGLQFPCLLRCQTSTFVTYNTHYTHVCIWILYFFLYIEGLNNLALRIVGLCAMSQKVDRIKSTYRNSVYFVTIFCSPSNDVDFESKHWEQVWK